MIFLKSMSAETFENFKQDSQTAYAISLSSVEGIPVEVALKSASEQFDRLVPNGITTPGQSFFDVLEADASRSVGFLWLGTQNRFGRTTVSINDIEIKANYRGRGLVKILMNLVEEESRKIGASRIRLHLFYENEIAKNLYLAMGFLPTNMDMRKDL